MTIIKQIFYLLTLVLYLHTTAYADENTIWHPNVSTPLNQDNNPLLKIHYDTDTFETAYKSFVYSGNVTDAFALSYNAANQMNASLLWHERLAQTAIWTNHIDIALDEFFYLAKKKSDSAFLEKAIKIAKNANRYDKLISILEYQYEKKPDDIHVITDLASAYDKAGFPEKAIYFLQQSNAKQPEKIYLEQIANIMNELGDLKKQFSTLNQLEKQYGTSLSTTLAIAEIYYKQAKVQNAYQSLLRILNNPIKKNPTYWDTLAQLSWLLGINKVAHTAYTNLYTSKQINEIGVERLLLLQPKTANQQRLEIAMYGWHRYHELSLFLQANSLAIDLQDYQTLSELYRTPLSFSFQKQLKQNVLYWQTQALLFQSIGESKKARNIFLYGVMTHPHQTEFQLLYLDFLANQLSLNIVQQQTDYLQSALSVFQNKALSDDNWASTYARSLMLFDQPTIALSVLQNEVLEQHNLSWYILYAQILEELSYNKSAHTIRKLHWNIIQKGITSQSRSDYSFWEEYNELAHFFAPLSISYPLSSYLAAYSPDANAADSLTSFAISHNNYELLSYLSAYYYSRGVPAWAALRLAILRNDQIAMRNMLDTMSHALPRKDRIQAAQLIHATHLQKELAYEGLKNTSDAERYTYFQDAFLPTATTFKLTEEFEQYDVLQGLREKVEGKTFITPRLKIAPYTSLWKARTSNTGNLANHNYIEKILGIVIAKQMTRNEINLDLAVHQFLYTSYAAKLSSDYTVTSQLSASGKLSYNQRSLLSTFMLIAGLQDEAAGSIKYDFTVRDKAEVSIEFDRYLLQDRTFLGNGIVFSGAFNHKLWLDYPDFTLQLNGAINRFYPNNNALIPTRALSILPADLSPNAQTFLSENYWQTGLNFLFGENITENYTQTWRPYANVGMIYASTSGYGWNSDAGITGSVLGRDKLSFYYTRTSNNQGQSQINFIIGASYQLYL